MAAEIAIVHRDSLGRQMPDPNDLDTTLGYTGSNVTTITVTDGTWTWVQTLTYSGSNVLTVSAFVRQ